MPMLLILAAFGLFLFAAGVYLGTEFVKTRAKKLDNEMYYVPYNDEPGKPNNPKG